MLLRYYNAQHHWANQRTESFLYYWLCAHAMFEVTRFPAFVGALNVIQRVVDM